MVNAFKEIGQRLSNWGRWGDDDRLGTLNHIRPEHVVAAATMVRTGKVFDLGLPVCGQGIQMGTSGRRNPVHLMSITPPDTDGHPSGLIAADDEISMPLQSVTQWDGLAHVGYDGRFYNDVPGTSVSTMRGSTILSIDQIAGRGIVGRGVLLDVAAFRGVDALAAGDAIGADELEAVAARQGVSVGTGDILLIRTGWIRHFTIEGRREIYWNGEPGLDLSCAEWLHTRSVAAVASDNWAVEVMAPDAAEITVPLHCILIRDMGMTLGEIFDLERLSQDCANDGIWDFLFSAPPLKVVGGVGSPITPLAIK